MNFILILLFAFLAVSMGFRARNQNKMFMEVGTQGCADNGCTYDQCQAMYRSGQSWFAESCSNQGCSECDISQWN
jgi:hypothetical protein